MELEEFREKLNEIINHLAEYGDQIYYNPLGNIAEGQEIRDNLIEAKENVESGVEKITDIIENPLDFDI